jgi:hypothetical protein
MEAWVAAGSKTPLYALRDSYFLLILLLLPAFKELVDRRQNTMRLFS